MHKKVSSIEIVGEHLFTSILIISKPTIYLMQVLNYYLCVVFFSCFLYKIIIYIFYSHSDVWESQPMRKTLVEIQYHFPFNHNFDTKANCPTIQYNSTFHIRRTHLLTDYVNVVAHKRQVDNSRINCSITL